MRIPVPSARRENRLVAAVLFLLLLVLGIVQTPGSKLDLVFFVALILATLFLLYEFFRWYQDEHRASHELVGNLTTQLRQNHQELVEKDRVHKAVFDSAVEGLLLVDENGDLQMVNRAARRLFDIPEKDHLNGLWDRGSILLRRESMERYEVGERPLDRALMGEAVDLEIFRVRTESHPDGRWLSCSAHPVILENSTRHGAIMVARDITTLMDAQDHLQQSEQRLRGLLDKMPAMVWTTDTELVFQSSQGSALKNFGLEPDALVGKSMFEFFRTDDPDFKPIAQQRHAIRGDSSNYEFFWRERYYAVSVEPLTDPYDQIVGGIGIALDVTHDAAIRRQIDAARQIQDRLFPDSPPQLPGYEIWGATFPAEIAAGDYFDYVDICDGTMGLVVGDVSGHGIGPALLMADTRAYLRLLARENSRLETILERANHLLYHDTEPDKFVTLFMGKLDPEHGRFRYASAGHSTAYVFDEEGAVRDRLSSTTTPLGLFPHLDQSPSKSVKLLAGEMLVVLTDGVTEATRDPDSEDWYGEQRALELVRKHRHLSAEFIVKELHRSVHGFLGGSQQSDDITVLVLKVTG